MKTLLIINLLSLYCRLVSCSWHGRDSRQHHLQQGRFTNTRLLQPVRRGSIHDLHLPPAFVPWPERPAYQSCASQPHAGHGPTRNGSGANERRNGGPRDGPGHDASQPYGDAVQWALPNGTPGLCPFGARSYAAPSADFGWACRSRRNDGSRRLHGRRRNGGSKHQSVSSLRTRHHYFAHLSASAVVSASPFIHSSTPPKLSQHKIYSQRTKMLFIFL